MATSFDSIFEQFLLIIDDPRFVNNYTSDEFVLELSKNLYRAIGICGDYFYSNLNNYTLTQQQNESFIGNGISGELLLTITPFTNGSFYVSVDDIQVETKNYSYNSLLNKITISPIPVLNSDIYIGNYKIGEFIDNLKIQEVVFLARGMTIPYLEFQLQKQKHLNQIVYGKDYQVHSQANHIKENRETVDDVEKRLIRDMIMYSYHQDPNSLSGSVGG